MALWVEDSFERLTINVSLSSRNRFHSKNPWLDERLLTTTMVSLHSGQRHVRCSSRRYLVIKRPMDLSSMLRNVKQRKYRNKAEFAADLSLIWENCYTYNFEVRRASSLPETSLKPLQGHPIRVQARFMQQKADHHLEFLADRNDQNASSILPLLPMAVPSDSSAPSRQLTAAPTRLVTSRRGSSQAPAAATGEDEDAAGESEDEQGDQSFRHEAGAGPQSHTAAQTQEGQGGAASSDYHPGISIKIW